MPGRGPIILSDFRQVIYQSGMKGGGGGGGDSNTHSFHQSCQGGGGNGGSESVLYSVFPNWGNGVG